MKDLNKQLEFVELRAQGLSYQKIADQIGVDRKTCERWGKEYADEIKRQQAGIIESVLETCQTAREARIKRLSDVLERIHTTLEETEFTAMPSDKLLKYALAYEQQLKTEQTETLAGFDLGTGAEENILAVCAQIFREQAGGAISGETATGLFKSLSKVVEAVRAVENVNPLENIFSSKNEIEL